MKKLWAQLYLLVKKHAWAILFGVIVGILSVMPHLFAMHALGDAYQGIPFLYSANEDYYLSRINEITDGHPLVGSPYFSEYKSSLPIVPPVGEWSYVLLSLLLHISLPTTLLVAKFLYPAILFLLSYALIRTISEYQHEGSGNMLGAIAGGLLITLGFDVIDYQTLFSRLLHGSDRLILSVWVRSVNPITGALLLFSYLLLLMKVLRSNSKTYAISAGIVLALSCGYIFTFVLGITILGAWGLLLLFEKKYETFNKFIIVAVVGIGIDALYWTSIIPSLLGGSNAERSGMLYMHTPLLNKVILATLLVLTVILAWIRIYKDKEIFSRKNTYRMLWFTMALPISGFIALNEQILTGRAIWPYHYIQYTIPLSFVALCVYGFILVRPHAKFVWNIFAYSAIVISLLMGIWNATTYRFQMEEYEKLQQFAPIFTWLNANTQHDCVVLVDEGWSDTFTNFVPSFTHCNVYLTGNITNIVPDSRITHNFFVKLRLLGVSSSTVETYLNNNEDAVKIYFYKDWLELLSPLKSDRIATLTPTLSAEYRVFLEKDFATALKEYRIDYIITQDHMTPNAEQDLSTHLTPVFHSGTRAVYHLK